MLSSSLALTIEPRYLNKFLNTNKIMMNTLKLIRVDFTSFGLTTRFFRKLKNSFLMFDNKLLDCVFCSIEIFELKINSKIGLIVATVVAVKVEKTVFKIIVAISKPRNGFTKVKLRKK